MEIDETYTPAWSSLSEDIVHNILARLPLLHFQRARSVCSVWNRLATNLAFSSLHGDLSQPRSLPGFALFLSNDSSSQLFYLDLNEPSKWRCISLAFLPNSGANSKLLASSGGLLLLSSCTSNLLIANPITKQWIQLPPTQAICEPFYTALMADASLGTFAVAVADSELQNLAATEIYESKTGQWRAGTKPARTGQRKTVASSMSAPWFFGLVPVYCEPVYCGGAFYHLTWDPEKMVSELSLEEGEWRCKKGSGAVPGETPWGIMEDRGKVTLLEMSYHTKDKRTEGAASGASARFRNHGGEGLSREAILSLWELQRDCLRWVLTQRIRPPRNSESGIIKWRRFAIGEGFLCITFLQSGTITTIAGQSDRQPGMIYDCKRAMWLPMPDLPGIPWGNISCLFSYKASLHPL